MQLLILVLGEHRSLDSDQSSGVHEGTIGVVHELLFQLFCDPFISVQHRILLCQMKL